MKKNFRFDPHKVSYRALRLLLGIRESFLLCKDVFLAFELLDEKLIVDMEDIPTLSRKDIEQWIDKTRTTMSEFIHQTLTQEEIEYIMNIEEHFLNDTKYEIKTRQLADKIVTEGYEDKLKETAPIRL